jgi:MORN repeat variant
MARVRFIGGDQARRCGRQLIVVALCLPTTALHATELDCEFNGQRVSGNNQVYSMRTSGWLRCWDRTSQLPVSEAQWVDGQPYGLNRRYQDGVLRSEYTRTRGSLREGLAREWNAQGVLRSENHYQNSVPVGLQRQWFDNGQPKSFYFQDEKKPGYTLAQIDFNQQGQITKLLCAKRVVLSAEAQACGHLGTTTTELFSDGGLLLSRVTYDGGELTKKETLSSRGTVKALEERTFTALGLHVRGLGFRDDGSVHRHSEIDEEGISFNRHFNAAGAMLSDKRARGDRLLREMAWDESGLLRELALYDQAGGRWTQQFHDNGELSFEGHTRADRDEALPGRGTHRSFHRNGRPREEVRFDAQGFRVFERAWDQEGRLLRDVSQPDSAFTVLMDRTVRSSFGTGTLGHPEFWPMTTNALDPHRSVQRPGQWLDRRGAAAGFAVAVWAAHRRCGAAGAVGQASSARRPGLGRSGGGLLEGSCQCAAVVSRRLRQWHVCEAAYRIWPIPHAVHSEEFWRARGLDSGRRVRQCQSQSQSQCSCRFHPGKSAKGSRGRRIGTVRAHAVAGSRRARQSAESDTRAGESNALASAARQARASIAEPSRPQMVTYPYALRPSLLPASVLSVD